MCRSSCEVQGRSPRPHACRQRPTAWTAAALLMALFAGCAKPADSPEIRAVLSRQQDAWNVGDLGGFLSTYWNSDELVFKTPTGETRGWQAVLERYQRRYPTRREMGSLRLQVDTIAPTGDETAEVAGRYQLSLEDGSRPHGRFYLHLRKIDGAWLIVRDFTVAD